MKPFFMSSAFLAFLYPIYAEAGSFALTDQRSPIELSEQTRVYLDGKLVAVFHLDDKTSSKTIKINTADGRMIHTYALCGQITILDPEGHTQIREVSGSGTLHHPDGHHLLALGNQDFTTFYLDDLEDPSVARHSVRKADACSRAIS